MSIHKSLETALGYVISNPNLRLDYDKNTNTWSAKKQNFILRLFRKKQEISDGGETKIYFSTAAAKAYKKIPDIQTIALRALEGKKINNYSILDRLKKIRDTKDPKEATEEIQNLKKLLKVAPKLSHHESELIHNTIKNKAKDLLEECFKKVHDSLEKIGKLDTTRDIFKIRDAYTQIDAKMVKLEHLLDDCAEVIKKDELDALKTQFVLKAIDIDDSYEKLNESHPKLYPIDQNKKRK